MTESPEAPQPGPLGAPPPGAPPARPRPPQLDFEDAFAFIFKAPGGWATLVKGGFLLLFFWLIIPGLLVMGWSVALGRTVAAGEYELPRFDIEMIVDGFKGVVVGFLYALPAILLNVLAVIAAVLMDSGPPSEPAAVAAGLGGALGSILVFAYSIALAAIQPAVFAVYIAKGTISSCFSYQLIKQVMVHFRSSYIAAAAILFGVSQLIALGVFLFIVGLAFTTFYYAAFMGHVAGQLARPLAGQSPETIYE